MARFFLGVLRKDGTEYEPDYLGSMYNSLDRHLRDMQSPISYVLTFLSFKIGIMNIENNIMSAEQHRVFQNFIIRAPPSFGGYPSYSNHSVRPHFLSYNNS